MPETVPAITQPFTYDAFISYRHLEPDREQARWLHEALETYKIPKELVAKGYPKKLTKVFLDQFELPASPNLTKDITDALDQSKYLIVVCSPRTPESEWVKAEIQRFRKAGRHDKILALLIEGEPKDSYPAQLTTIRRTVIDSAGPTHEEIENVEPLAADVRPERHDFTPRELERMALLRFVASIIGCTFDDLFQRDAQRHTKFARKVGIALAAAVLLLIGLTTFAFVQRGEAITSTGIANTKQKEAEDARQATLAAEAQTKARADELQKVSDFQANMLSQVDPKEAGKLLTADVTAKFEAALVGAGVPEVERAGQVEAFAAQWKRVNSTDAARDLIDRTILKPAADTIDKQFKDQPVVDASLRQVLAERYYSLGLLSAALPLQEQALATRRRVLGDDHLDTLHSITSLGDVWADMGDPGKAELFYREALEKRRKRLGSVHHDTLVSIGNVAYILKEQGKLAEAEILYHESLDECTRILGGEDQSTLTLMDNIGVLLMSEKRFDEAEPYIRGALQGRRHILDGDDPLILMSQVNLSGLLHAQGRLDEAESLCREAAEGYRRTLGDRHPTTLTAISNLGSILGDQGNLIAAEQYTAEGLIGRRASLGDDHPDTLTSMIYMASALRMQGRLPESESYIRDAVERSRRVLGDSNPITLRRLGILGTVLQEQGRQVQAEPYVRECLEKRRQVLGANHIETLYSTNSLSKLLIILDKTSDAEPYVREGLGICRRIGGEGTRDGLTAIANMGALLIAQGKPSEAEPYLRELLEKSRKVLGEDDPGTLSCLNSLGEAIRVQGRLSDAEPYFRQAYETSSRINVANTMLAITSTINLGATLEAMDRYDDALRILEPAVPAARKVLVGAYSRRLAALLMSLGKARMGLGAFAGAEDNLLEARPIFVKTRGELHTDTRECTVALIKLYTVWQAAEPGKGYDAKAAEWKAKLESNQPPDSENKSDEKK